MKKTEFSKAGYQAHMQEVMDKQPETQEALYTFLSSNFTAKSLTGEVREFTPNGRRLELNMGANVTASEPGKKETDFIFPVMLSELLEATMTDERVGKYFDHDVLKQVQKYALELESRYRTTQIPYINTLSATKKFSWEGKTPIPAIKRVRNPSDVFVKDENGLLLPSHIEQGKGIYVMASGNELGKEVGDYWAEQFHKHGYDIVSPKWLNLAFGKNAIPDVLFHPDIKLVMGRYGWGIGWLAQVGEKPYLSMPHLWFDNPEMIFNIDAMEEYGLGREFNGRLDIIEDVIRLQPGIGRLNEEIRHNLDLPEGVDGIRYAALNILQTAMKNVDDKYRRLEESAGYS